MMARILRALERAEEHWFVDLIAVVGLFASGYGLLLIGYGLGLK